MHAADVDEARPASTAQHGDQLLVADLGVQFGGGEVVAVPLDQQPALLVLVVGQTSENLAGGC